MPEIKVDEKRCKGCRLCVAACPKKCLELSENFSVTGYHPATMVKKESCIGCAMCFAMCPDIAITVYK